MSTQEPSGEIDRLIMQSASDGIFAADIVSGRILMANPSLEAITGHAAESLVQAPIGLLVPDSEAGSGGQDFSADLLERPGMHEDVRIRRADGYALHASMTVGHGSERSEVAVCVVRDESERRMLERELITKHVALRQAFAEVEKRNIELGEVSARLALASKRAALAELFAGVAHGLNNPLAALLSSNRLVRALLAELPSGDAHRKRGTALCDRIEQQGARMEAIIADLRGACRVGERRDEPVPVQAAREVESVLGLFKHRLAQVEVACRFEEVRPALAVPDDLHHVLSNLIDNALCAMDERGRVRIEIDEVGGAVEVAIEDSGPGIPREVADRLFEPFVSRRQGGTGIGLSVSGRLVRRWGGDLRLASSRDGGARLVITLPIKEDPCLRVAS